MQAARCWVVTLLPQPTYCFLYHFMMASKMLGIEEMMRKRRIKRSEERRGKKN